MPSNPDEVYVETQAQVEMMSRVLLGIDGDALDELIRRGDQAQGLGPIFHPSEFRAGTDKLGEVLTCARALKQARQKIAEVADAK